MGTHLWSNCINFEPELPENWNCENSDCVNPARSIERILQLDLACQGWAVESWSDHHTFPGCLHYLIRELPYHSPMTCWNVQHTWPVIRHLSSNFLCGNMKLTSNALIYFKESIRVVVNTATKIRLDQNLPRCSGCSTNSVKTQSLSHLRLRNYFLIFPLQSVLNPYMCGLRRGLKLRSKPNTLQSS